MKLLAPVNSLKTTIKQIKAGADEIYLGGDTQIFNSLSFSGRGRYNLENEKICPDFMELREIVQYAHSKDVTVMFTANIPFLAEDPCGSQKYLGHFYDYVENAMMAQVDSIVVGDLGAILFLKEKGVNVHLTSSSFLETLNRDQILFLKELGVNRVVLSYQILLHEIEELTSYNDLEIEIFGHFGCSFYDGYCNMKHINGETAEHPTGIPCQNFYHMNSNGKKSMKGQYLNCSLTCSLCSLPQISKSSVYALKLVGRELDMEQNYLITDIYHKALQKIEELTINGQFDMDTYKAFINNLLPEWWKHTLCRKGLCKYLRNRITESFTGL